MARLIVPLQGDMRRSIRVTADAAHSDDQPNYAWRCDPGPAARPLDHRRDWPWADDRRPGLVGVPAMTHPLVGLDAQPVFSAPDLAKSIESWL